MGEAASPAVLQFNMPGQRGLQLMPITWLSFSRAAVGCAIGPASAWQTPPPQRAAPSQFPAMITRAVPWPCCNTGGQPTLVIEVL